MRIYIEPPKRDWKAIAERAVPNDEDIEEIVGKIIASVKEDRDSALFKFSEDIDGVSLNRLEVSADEIEEASKNIPEKLKKAIGEAAANISRFHKAQLPSLVDVETGTGVRCLQKAVPINKIGLYIPGGRAPLFSTVLMLAIPAVIAGCKDIILCTPPGKDGKINESILYTASLCGVKRIFKTGGAQAVAAMALGTESITKRDKIFGPGNRFVTKAKQLLSIKEAAIDMPAGPSEVMVLADDSAIPEFVAADLLSQAEHGPDSQAILVCGSKSFALEVQSCIEKQVSTARRKDSIAKSIENSRIVVFEEREKILDFSEFYAPEHLIISLKDAWEAADKITTAGSVFIGNWTPESAGDYASGTNHTLPTSGWARSYSGVNIDSFMRKITFQEISREGLGRLSETIITMAEAEGLEAHANAVKIRIQR